MRKMIFQKAVVFMAISFISCCLFLISSCGVDAPNDPDAYHLQKPQQITLGKVLNEVSGIFYNTSDTSLLAISDSKERVFQLNLKKNKLFDYTNKIVNPDSDLEDLVKIDTAIFLLQSRGVIKELRDGVSDGADIKSYDLPVTGINDFEAMYYDPAVKSLIVLCKTCAFEKGLGLRTAFRFDLASRTFDTTAFYTINKEEVRKQVKSANAKFDPSAAAINPLDKRLYILSSAGNLLVVTDTRGQVKEAYPLNPDIFPQAEGIAFAPDGTMYITNEGKYGRPNLLVFAYQHSGKKKTER